MSEYKISKSLRWICNQIPDNLGDSNEERMLKCIKLYCQQGAETIEEFEKRIENGTLVELPCKVGTTIYHILDSEVKQDTVFRYEFEYATKPLVYFDKYIKKAKRTWKRPFELVENFNKTWFLTKAEAEAKLKELKGEV